MPKEKEGSVVSAVTALAGPLAEELNLRLWDVEFVKEGSSWYLRFYIDKDPGVTIEDCENFSRRVDVLLDEADPISQSYFLEVSSPGTERELKKIRHFELMKGEKVKIRMIRPDEKGRKEITGILKGLENGVIEIEQEGAVQRIPRSDTAFVRLYDDFIGGID